MEENNTEFQPKQPDAPQQQTPATPVQQQTEQYQQPQYQQQSISEPAVTFSKRDIEEILYTASSMSGWLKFLGIFNIVYGAFIALSIVGIIFAWIPIWAGVLMIQAANRAEYAESTGDIHHLGMMLQKLKTYFIVTGIIIILCILLVAAAVIFFISFWPSVEQLLPRMHGLHSI
jgi:Fe2+ transport system protein B